MSLWGLGAKGSYSSSWWNWESVSCKGASMTTVNRFLHMIFLLNQERRGRRTKFTRTIRTYMGISGLYVGLPNVECIWPYVFGIVMNGIFSGCINKEAFARMIIIRFWSSKRFRALLVFIGESPFILLEEARISVSESSELHKVSLIELLLLGVPTARSGKPFKNCRSCVFDAYR